MDVYYYPNDLGRPAKIVAWRELNFFVNIILVAIGIFCSFIFDSHLMFIIAIAITFLTVCVDDDTIGGYISYALKFASAPKVQRWANKTQRSMSLRRIDDKGILHTDTDKFVAWKIVPKNIATLSTVTVKDYVTKVTDLLIAEPRLEFYCADMSEDMDNNISYLQRRLSEEKNENVKAIIEADITHIRKIEASNQSNRVFLAVYKLPKNDVQATSDIARISRALYTAGLGGQEITKEEMKRVIASYFGEPCGHKIPDFDGQDLI